MTDSENPFEGMHFHPINVPIEALPPELQQVMRAQQLNMQLHTVEARHAIHSLIEGLDKEGLETLRNLFTHLVSNPRPDLTCTFFEGVITSRLQTKFGECPGCGQNHDEALANMSDGEEQVGEQPDATWSLSEDQREALMKEYGVRPHPEEAPPAVQCDRCHNWTWAHLGERMKKRPDESGCPSCVHTQKWG